MKRCWARRGARFPEGPLGFASPAAAAPRWVKMVPAPADALPRPSAGAPGRQSPLPAAAGGAWAAPE